MANLIETKTFSSPLVHKLKLQRQAFEANLHKCKNSSLMVAYAPWGGQNSTAVPFTLWRALVVQGPSSSKKQCTPRIEKHYKQITCFDLLLQCELDGIMGIPSPNRVILSNSSKKVTQDKKELVVELSAVFIISGQKPQATWAKRSIAGFKLRRGEPLGCKVTLRGNPMYTLLDKLVNVVLPRARPSMINHAINGATVYNIGIGDPFQFYELEHHFDLFQSLCGFDVSLLTAPAYPSIRDAKAVAALLWSGLQLIA
jgi:large subunit ribosomal protein L5